MIILIGLILALCLAGAWIALTLEGKAPQGRSQDSQEMSESNQDGWWSQVEAGPDGIEPNGSNPDFRS